MVTTMRVFMWTAGTCGFCGCAITEMPDAQKRGMRLGAGNLRAEFRGELAEDGGDVHAHLLEDAAVHDRHDAAAARHAGMVGPLPGGTDETAGLAVAERRLRGQLVLHRFEGSADRVAQLCKPGGSLRLAGAQRGGFLALQRVHAKRNQPACDVSSPGIAVLRFFRREGSAESRSISARSRRKCFHLL